MKPVRVGIVGAGQLGRMLALAAYPLGIRCTFLDTDPGASAAEVGEIVVGSRDDPKMLARLASQVDVLTFDIENVHPDSLRAMEGALDIHPPPAAMVVAQDRLAEKRLFQALDIPTARFVPVASAEDLKEAATVLGWPIVLKARRLGYDGRGQRIAASQEELAAAWRALGEVPAIAEAHVPFERELSLIAVRGARGAQVFYPLAENVHDEGILTHTIAPYLDHALQRRAEEWLAAIGEHLAYRGVLTVEFFDTGDGLLANEMAPRVHNSGHWTIEGAETSQFENHLRSILGWPLGETTPRGHAAMVNLLGELPPVERILRIPGAHLHCYGKAPKPRRKLGHCTIVDSDRDRLEARLAKLQAAIRGNPG